MLSRKAFIKYLWILIASPFILIWALAYLFEKRKSDLQNTISISKPLNDGFYTYDNFFINIKGETVLVLARKCTHLGCKLLDAGADLIKCPCHGSVFTKDGKLIQGPAKKDLTRLNHTFDEKSDKISIRIQD